MSPLALPGPQVGPNRASGRPAIGPNKQEKFGDWFPYFIKKDLSPYPGRVRIVTRMVIAATVAMFLIMSFHLIGAGIAGVYTLFVSRESPQATFRNARVMIASYLFGTVYLLVGLLLFINYPLTHFLWVVVNLFLSFYLLRVSSNSVAAAAFGITTTLVIPIWDVTAPTELLLVQTLWTVGGIGIGLGATVLVEYAFSSFGAKSDLLGGLRERAEAVAAVLSEYSDGQASISNQERLAALATVGTSRLHALAAEPHLQRYAVGGGQSTISLVGRLVDLTIAFHDQLGSREPSNRSRDSERVKCLIDCLRWVSTALDCRGHATSCPSIDGENATGPFWISELEHTTQDLVLSLSSDAAGKPESVEQKDHQQVPWLAPDAFQNPEHLRYALKGCVAATLCYIFMNAVAYQGIRTALVTCFITSLTSTGASRQKQLLRLIGAVLGGLVLGVGGQALVLPMLDGIAGFTIFFVAVTGLSAWVATSSTRLSYLGIQMALAFYLINLQEPYPQTNLAIGRDRVLGIGLGLIAMWLIFDIVGAKSAVMAMRDILKENLDSLAELVELSHLEKATERQRMRNLRDKISVNFGLLNAQADGVLFETGERRLHDLEERAKLLNFQTHFRELFFLEVGLKQCRVDTDEREFTPESARVQLTLSALTAQKLRLVARGLDARRTVSSSPNLPNAQRSFEESLDGGMDKPSFRVQAVLSLTSHIATVVETLQQDLRSLN